MVSFGVVPNLSLQQRLRLAVSGQLFLRFMQPSHFHAPVPVYVVNCSIHGLYLDTPHGDLNPFFLCPDCFAETNFMRKVEAH